MSQKSRANELAACAFMLFAREGLDRVTMDAIAAEANVTKGSLYWHYKSKEELIRAACRHYYREWHRTTQLLIAPVSDPVDSLIVVIRASVQSCLIDEPNRVFTMEIITRSLYDQAIREGWRQFFDGVKSFYLSLTEAAVETGALSLEDPEAAVDGMLAAMEGYKLRAIFEPELCSKPAEASICKQLLGLLGISD